ARVVQQRYAVSGEDRLNAAAVGLHQALDPVLPLALPEAHAHGDAKVEVNLRARLERHDGQLGGRGVLREVAGDRPPHERDIDLPGRQVLLDDLARIALRVAGLELIGNDLIDQAVPEQPIRRRRLTDHAELERFQLRRLEIEQALGSRYAVEPFAFHIDQGVGRAVVGLGGRRQLESDGYTHYQVACEAIGDRSADAQRG